MNKHVSFIREQNSLQPKAEMTSIVIRSFITQLGTLPIIISKRGQRHSVLVIKTPSRTVCKQTFELMDALVLHKHLFTYSSIRISYVKYWASNHFNENENKHSHEDSDEINACRFL